MVDKLKFVAPGLKLGLGFKPLALTLKLAFPWLKLPRGGLEVLLKLVKLFPPIGWL